MAKVINPLLSGSASGQLGHMMTFDKRGYVRQYVVPANPKSVGQMAVRNTMGDLQRSLKTLGVVLRAELRAGLGSRWNSVIIGELMATGNAALTAYNAELAAFTAPEKAAWATADTSVSVDLTDGQALYACASAAKDIATRLGVTLTLATPINSNAVAVGAAWIANA